MAVIMIIAGSIFISSHAYGFDNTGKWTHITCQVPQTEIKSIVSLPDGRICAGTDSSFHIFDRVRWTKYSYPSDLKNHAPFYCDSEGTLYFLDNNFLVTWNKGKITRFDGVELMDPIIAPAGDGLFYIGSLSPFGGIFTFNGKSIVKIKDGNVRSLAVDTSGQLWATLKLPGLGYFSLMALENGEWIDRTSEIDSLAPIGNNLTVQAAPDGAVWVCNDFSYGVFLNGIWTFRRNSNGNPGFLTFDNSGRIWGYSYQQLFLLDASGSWKTSWTTQNMLSGSQAYMAAAPDGSVWTFDGFRIYSYIGDKWKQVENSYDLASDIVTCMAYTGEGKLMCGHGIRGLDYDKSSHLGISIREDSSWVNYKSYDWLQFPDVYDMKTQRNGDVMVFSNAGFFVYSNGVWSSIDTLKTFKETDMAWDLTSPDGMWITTTDGLLNWQDPIFTFYPVPQKLTPYRSVYNICFDNDDNIYMQGNYGTVLFTDRQDWKILSVLDVSSINDLAVDKNGIIWAARKGDISQWFLYSEWRKIIDLDIGRLVKFDSNDILWFSGFGATGYMENENVKIIPELSQSASDYITFSGDERIAINAFDRDRTRFYGFYEYTPEEVYVADNGKPIQFITATSFPNPFNPFVTIQFELPKSGKASIKIYNITGQLVSTIADRSFNAGSNKVQWNSRTDLGNECSSGLYFYRIDSGKTSATGKMILLR
jgi:hypothetical protein